SDDHHENRDHHGYDGTVDEKPGHGSVTFRDRIALFEFHDGSIANFLQAFGYDEFTRRHAFVNDPHGADAITDFYGSKVDLVPLADNRHLIGSLKFAYGSLRDQQCAIHGFCGNAHAAELARAENVVGIREGRNNANASRGHIYLAVGVEDFSFLWIHGAISQQELQRRSVGRRALSAACVNSSGEAHVSLLANRKIRFDGIYAGD